MFYPPFSNKDLPTLDHYAITNCLSIHPPNFRIFQTEAESTDQKNAKIKVFQLPRKAKSVDYCSLEKDLISILYVTHPNLQFTSQKINNLSSISLLYEDKYHGTPIQQLIQRNGQSNIIVEEVYYSLVILMNSYLYIRKLNLPHFNISLDQVSLGAEGLWLDYLGCIIQDQCKKILNKKNDLNFAQSLGYTFFSIMYSQETALEDMTNEKIKQLQFTEKKFDNFDLNNVCKKLLYCQIDNEQECLNFISNAYDELIEQKQKLNESVGKLSTQMILEFYCLIGDLDQIKKFSDSILKLKEDQITWHPLITSSFVGSLEIIKYLIEDLKIDPYLKNEDNNIGLTIAAKSGHIHIVKYFIEDLKVDPNYTNNYTNSSLALSSQGGHLHVVKYLIEEKGVNPDQETYNGNTILSQCAHGGNLHVLRYLIDEAKVDVHKEAEQTALKFSTLNKTLDMMKYLIEEVKVDVNQKDSFKDTALTLSAYNGNFEAVKYLCKVGKADIDSRDDWGSNALMLSCQQGFIEIVKFLIDEMQADVDEQNDQGDTPFLYCVGNYQVQIARKLFEDSSCDIHITTYDDWDANKIAQGRNDQKSIDYIGSII